MATPKPYQNHKRLADEREKDAVQVFCRIRPLQAEADLTCLKVESCTTVVLVSPEIAVNYRLNSKKETQYIFKHVFQSNSKQREVFQMVAEPLIENLIHGKNSLLFTYGVTGSGKTFTMTGDKNDRGILPRSLDSLFMAISDYQAKKFVFKPDRLNGFEILSDADAMLERQAEMNSKFCKPKRQDSENEIASKASTDPKLLLGLDEDNIYAVFVTYIEIYNNSVYDLLEDSAISKTLQSKIIREDGSHNMYVHGVTEVEVKSADEGLKIFQMGQKRKRMGHTILNAESSRSHSVFTIRLVQAPTDDKGEAVIPDKNIITISQFSLVDLAGSERTNRTKNTGQRLQEAGNINKSLMTLRTCLEYLRENQVHGLNKKVPYRDSKITHFFKNYFEGEGQVNMIVCINPRAEDYDENTQVMKFAEMTQEVQVAKQTPIRPDIGLTPGRRKANKIFKEALSHLNNLGIPEAQSLEFDLGLVYNLGSNFPNFDLKNIEKEKLLQQLIQHLEFRIGKRKVLLQDLDKKSDFLRANISKIEQENISLKTELASVRAVLKQEKNKSNALENKVFIFESSIDDLNRKLKDRDEQIKDLQKTLSRKQQLLSQREKEQVTQRKIFNTKMAVEADKMSKELETKLKMQKNKLQEKMRVKDEKLRLVSNILKAENVQNFPTLSRSSSAENVMTSEIAAPKATSSTVTYHTPRPVKGIPVANIRHRRSRSAGEKWLEHRAPNPVPLGTILQPYLKNRKSVTKLTEAKDLTNSKTSKYCLISQEADTDGEVETKLYKGNVIPTTGGGAQIVFNDVECLKQKSPVPSPSRKRPSNIAVSENFKDLGSRCTISIEGHGYKKPKV